MCYTGKCRYEGFMGGPCKISFDKMPEDAACAIAEKEIQKVMMEASKNDEKK